MSRNKSAGKKHTYSGKIRDVRKSLAGGNEGRTSCVSTVRGANASGTGTRFASDRLLRDGEHERRDQEGSRGGLELWSVERGGEMLTGSGAWVIVYCVSKGTLFR